MNNKILEIGICFLEVSKYLVTASFDGIVLELII